MIDWKAFFERIGRLKVYFASAGFYIGFANFVLILATFKRVYNVNISVLVFVPVGFLFVMLIGYLDYKLVLKYQLEHGNKVNDLKHQLNRIERLVEDKKNVEFQKLL